ncbi:MAG TPA: hypothetical protein DCZ91_04805 [Lachnospiraceae bacterium]|nr:hypothetical protein [Lachnospiraceae bacterium]
MQSFLKITGAGGHITEVEIFPTYYPYNRTLAVVLFIKGSRRAEMYGNLTCCLDDAPGRNRAYIDINNMGEDVLEALEEGGFGARTGRQCRSGYVTYPEFEFREDVLKAYAGKDYKMYLKWQDGLKDEEEYISAKCRQCRKNFTFIVKKSAARKFREYEQGARYLIQDIFPEMSAADRGLFARGQNMCGICFRRMFG